jgi:hypothetical protein
MVLGTTDGNLKRLMARRVKFGHLCIIVRHTMGISCTLTMYLGTVECTWMQLVASRQSWMHLGTLSSTLVCTFQAQFVGPTRWVQTIGEQGTKRNKLTNRIWVHLRVKCLASERKV